MTSNLRHAPLYDINAWTGATIEVFYADRRLETFGWRGAGWFWQSRRRGLLPVGPAIGPFDTSYAAYRHATGTDLGTVARRSSGDIDAVAQPTLDKVFGRHTAIGHKTDMPCPLTNVCF
jgi:hypothetical protein